MNDVSVSPLLAQPAALFAGLALALMIYRLGRGTFAGRLFADSLATGAIMGATLLLVESPFDLRHNPMKYSTSALAFGFAGFPEEGAKLFAVYFFVGRHYLRRSARDLALGAAAASLGFALLENMLYIANGGANWGGLAVSRAMTAVPFHVLLGIAGSFAFPSNMNTRGGRRFLRAAAIWVVVASLHGAYDFAIFNLDGRAPLPTWMQGMATSLGLAAPSLLSFIALAAMAATSALALWRLATLRGESGFEAPRATRVSSLLLSRPLGYGAAALLLAPLAAFVFLFPALRSLPEVRGWLAFAAASLALPLVLAILIARDPLAGLRPPKTAGAMRLVDLATALGILALALAGFRWGLPVVRELIALPLVTSGAQKAQSGDLKGAVLLYDEALAVAPDSPEALLSRAAAKLALKDAAAAIVDANRAVALRPDDVRAWLLRGEVEYDQHDLKADLADLTKALDLRPLDGESWARRARVDIELGDFENAKTDLARAAQLAPRDPRVLAAQGYAAEALGDLDAALEYFTSALSAKPDALGIVFDRARIEYFRGDMNSAVADLRRASEGLSTIYPGLWLFLATARTGGDGGPELAARQLRLNDGSWPFPIVRYFEGQIDAQAMRAAASSDDERCEADFYAGEFLLARGPNPAGLERLARAKKECPRYYIEKDAAEIEWTRLTSPDPGHANPASGAPTSPNGPVSWASLITPQQNYAAKVEWSFVDQAAGEVRADIAFALPKVQFHLRLARTPAPSGPAYVLRLIVPPDELSTPPLSAMGDGLGAPILFEGQRNSVMPALTTFRKVDPGTYEMKLPPENMGEILRGLRSGGTLQILLEFANRKPLRLAIGLNAASANVWRTAGDAWGL